MNWSGLPVVHVRPTVLLDGFFLIFTPESARESDQIRLPFGQGKTSPVAVEDVARVTTALLADPGPHIGKVYHLTGPESADMHAHARQYSKALSRTITFQDIPLGPWRDGLLPRTARAQYHLRQVFVYLNIHAINQPEVMIAGAGEKFDAAGALTDERTREAIRQLLQNLVEWTRRLRPAGSAL